MPEPLQALENVVGPLGCVRLPNQLEDAAARMDLSPRAVHRVLKVARTLADLEADERVRHRHLAEALSYRGLESTELS